MTTEYSHFECDIEPDGLTFAKLADGRNVMTDGCNLDQKTNKGVYITVYKVYSICGCTNDIYFPAFVHLKNISKY